MARLEEFRGERREVFLQPALAAELLVDQGKVHLVGIVLMLVKTAVTNEREEKRGYRDP